MASRRQNLARTNGLGLALALSLMFVIFGAQVAQAETFNVLYNFTGGADGSNPYAGLTMDRFGAFYGTTLTGGTGHGTVFKLAKIGSSWTLTTLYTFAGGSDGASPRTRVIMGSDGNLYGETTTGGGSGCGGRGCGTIFKLRRQCQICSSWTEVVLYRFTGGTDGAEPIGDLVFDASGTLYGTTVQGGKPHGCGGAGCGTVFKLVHSGGTWTETVLYQFFGLSDAAFPNGGVIFDHSGNLYGTTCCGTLGNSGTVFELTPEGGSWSEKILYAFQGTTDGKEPVAGLMFDSLGNLYGTTIFGGSGLGGTIFKLTPSGGSWTFGLLYSLRGVLGSYGTLTKDAAGNLYSTTFQDGLHLYGSVFKLTSSGGSWSYGSLHDFTDNSDGGFAASHLIFDSSGNLYGTAALGGTHGFGVIVQITP